MNKKPSNSPPDSGDAVSIRVNWRTHRTISLFLKLCLAIGAVLLFWQERYQSGAETILILIITFLPTALDKHFQVKIPYEFESLAVLFIYLSLFLGEVHGYYLKYWWWDSALHLGSGLLLGILGFLLVYVMNEKRGSELGLKPAFMAIFAFMFAMGIAALWEIFEFAMDQLFNLTMQETGLVDTMWDLIIDGIGALVISLLGWSYLGTKESDSFLEDWIDDFIEKNPKLFRRGAGKQPKGEP